MNQALKVTKIAGLTGHKGAVYAITEYDNSGHFLTGGSDRIVAQWNIHQPGDGEMVAGTNNIIYSMLTIPQQGILLVGQSSGGIHVVDLTSRKELRLLQYHTAPVFDLAHSLKHNLLFSLSGDGELGIMDAKELTLTNKLLLGNGKLRAVAINPDETIVAVGAADGSIYTFELPSMKPLQHWQAHREGFSVNALCFSPDGNHLLSGSRDAHLNVYDVKNNFELLKSIPAHNYAIYAIAFNPAGTIFATASRDKTIKLWDSASYDLLLRIDKEKNDGHSHSVNKLIWHQETGNLITTGDDRSVIVWEVE